MEGRGLICQLFSNPDVSNFPLNPDPINADALNSQPLNQDPLNSEPIYCHNFQGTKNGKIFMKFVLKFFFYLFKNRSNLVFIGFVLEKYSLYCFLEYYLTIMGVCFSFFVLFFFQKKKLTMKNLFFIAILKKNDQKQYLS